MGHYDAGYEYDREQKNKAELENIKKIREKLREARAIAHSQTEASSLICQADTVLKARMLDLLISLDKISD